MERNVLRQVDTVIVGNGPSALILSYILHGHIPVYDRSSPHPDPLLHQKLKDSIDLLDTDVDHLTEHFDASRFSYSTQALPINVLLDTLIRPLGETDGSEKKTCVQWRYDPTRVVPHLVVGNATQTGGQWVSNHAKASWDIGTLSYAGMLSLPGYEFSDFYYEHYGEPLPFYSRPTRRDVAKYFATYPYKVGIDDSIHYDETLSGIRRVGSGFHIASHNISCDHLVLASGVFTNSISPTPPVRLLQNLPSSPTSEDPILVIGSGFSAADVILSTSSDRKIIHVYKWAPTKNPSPLKACHQQAYPEYAGVYRKMKLAALASKQSKGRRPSLRRASVSTLDTSRDWLSTYEGLPNVTVVDAEIDGDGAIVTFQTDSEITFQRRISSLAYVVGRRGSLGYLDPKLRDEVCPHYDANLGLSGRDMRDQANEDLEVTKNVFIIGSLTGDTLIRFAYGGCAYAAGQIMKRNWLNDNSEESGLACGYKRFTESDNHSFVPAMSGLDGHAYRVQDWYQEILPLDRRKIVI